MTKSARALREHCASTALALRWHCAGTAAAAHGEASIGTELASILEAWIARRSPAPHEVNVGLAPPNDSSRDPMIGRRLGSYCLVRKIAQGGMGAVYEAAHAESGQRAAVKVLLPELTSNQEVANRFFNEAQAIRAVSHPSLVAIYEHGTHGGEGGQAYLAMEFIDGESLREHLETHYVGGGVIPIMSQLASALEVTHRKRIAHRDLKPENVMVVLDETLPGGKRVKILDFGIAKLLPDGSPEEDRRSVRTRTGTLIGTPTYMSPEQCRAAAAPDEKTDVYSLGVIFYEMIYGAPPFVSESAGELFALHMFAAPTPLIQRVPAVDAKLAELVHRMLEKDPAPRPSMAAVCGALKAIPRSGLTDAPATARPSSVRAGQIGEASVELGTAERILPNMRTGQTVARGPSAPKHRTTIVVGLCVLIVIAILAGVGLRRKTTAQLPASDPRQASADAGALHTVATPPDKEAAISKPTGLESGLNAPTKPGRPTRKDKPPRRGHGSKDAKQVHIDLWN